MMQKLFATPASTAATTTAITATVRELLVLAIVYKYVNNFINKYQVQASIYIRNFYVFYKLFEVTAT